jgi:protein-disulfide isomerase
MTSRQKKARSRLLSVLAITATLIAAAFAVSKTQRLSQPLAAHSAELEVIPNWGEYMSRGVRLGPRGAESDDVAVTIVVFSDYQCPHCLALDATLSDLRARYPDDIAVIYRHFPLQEVSLRAAIASECGARQGMFESIHHEFFRQVDSLGIKPWTAIALDAGITDTRTFDACMNDSTAFSAVARDVRAGQDLGVRGTPSLLVNELFLPGDPGARYLSDLVSSVLGRVGRAAGARTMRNSAGIQVVTYSAADRPEELWRISSSPLITVGKDGPPGVGEFFMVAGVNRLRDGSIAVADGSSREIRLFDPSGEHLVTFGGRGEGPGELGGLWELWRNGDTLIAVGGQRHPAEVFRISGSQVEHVRTVPPLTSETAVPVRRRGYLGDGTLIGTYVEPLEESPLGLSNRIAAVVKQAGASGSFQFVARESAYQVVRLEADHRPSALVYGPRLHVGVLRDGFCLGYSREYTVRCFDSDGREHTRVVREWKRYPVRESDRQLFFDGIDEANPGPRGATYRHQVRETTAFAEHLPPFGRFLVTSENELWVGPLVLGDETLGELNPSPQDETVWSIYSARGRWLADITLPARFRPMDVGADYVAGVARDERDVESVVVYSIVRR